MTDQEILYKILGDDFAAPPEGFSINQFRDGIEHKIIVSAK